MRLTDRDAYWGAKIVTSFSDAQIGAVVDTARLPPGEAAYLAYALRVRRDKVGRRYLRAMTAVESPALSADGGSVCFDDLATARGYVGPHEARYEVEVEDGHGVHLAAFERASEGARTCVPIGGVGRGTGYRVVTIRTRLAATHVSRRRRATSRQTVCASEALAYA